MSRGVIEASALPMTSIRAFRLLGYALRRIRLTFEKAPYLYLCCPVHTLDDAHGGRGWLEKAGLLMALEESPLGPSGGSDR